MVSDNNLEESIDPIKEAFLHMVEDGDEVIKLDTVLEIFEEMGVTGLDPSVMERVYGKVMDESLLFEFTWEERVLGGLDGTEPGKPPLGKGGFTAKMVQFLDDRTFRDERLRRLYEDKLVFKDKRGNEIKEYLVNYVDDRQNKTELALMDEKEKHRQEKFGPQEVWRWLNDAREPSGKHFPKSKFPIRVYFHLPLLQSKATQDAIAKKEVTLEMFRQLVSYGQSEYAFEDLLRERQKSEDDL
jgi:hypothetical protein